MISRDMLYYFFLLFVPYKALTFYCKRLSIRFSGPIKGVERISFLASCSLTTTYEISVDFFTMVTEMFHFAMSFYKLSALVFPGIPRGLRCHLALAFRNAV